MGAIQQILLAGGGGSAQQYWNPATCDSHIGLSGGGNNLASRLGGSLSTWFSVLAVQSRSTGKKYFEIEDTFQNPGPNMMAGVGTSAMSLTNFPGAGTTSWGVHANATGNETYFNGSSSNSSGGTGAITAGGYAKIAVDFDAGKLWLGLSTSGWKGGGDPAAGTTPTYTFTANTALFPALGEFTTQQQCTLRLLSSEMAGTIPSGFSSWS